ncbi:hypothetical protein KDL01_10975 [Actinospica durhamensis]|uniref:Uncharacterized protein n=1 Tax=Actinospica durhamensis TaxID=1508375 RepID=A0A941EM10_9ACTN|nr:hypothetical protein [Actinospica durhamensis]MBR7833791.1 hypothetical protein [Actinospica durhamensis]
MNTREPDYMRLLVESLEILAADPQVQIAFIDKPGLSADDLAEDHVAPAGNAKWMHAVGLISLEVRVRAERIDELFTAMSGAANAERWTHLALQTDPGWAEVRTLAREALAMLQPGAVGTENVR